MGIHLNTLELHWARPWSAHHLFSEMPPWSVDRPVAHRRRHSLVYCVQESCTGTVALPPWSVDRAIAVRLIGIVCKRLLISSE